MASKTQDEPKAPTQTVTDPPPQAAAATPPGAEPAAAAPQGPTIIHALDEVSLMLEAQARQGLRTIEDFDEGDFALAERQHPKEFPDRVNGVEVRYVALSAEAPHMHPYFRFAAPVSRATLPGLPEHLYGVKGVVQEGANVWFFMDRRVYERLKREARRRMDDLVVSLNREDHEVNEEGGGVFTGVKSSKSVAPD